MQAEDVEPGWKLDDIALQHPFIAGYQIGVVRGLLPIFVVEDEFYEHFVPRIGDRGCAYLSDANITCQAQVGLHECGEPEQTEGNHQQHKAENAPHPPETRTMAISLHLPPVLFSPLTFLALFPLMFVMKQAQQRSQRRDEQNQANEARYEQDDLRRPYDNRYIHALCPAFRLSSPVMALPREGMILCASPSVCTRMIQGTGFAADRR